MTATNSYSAIRLCVTLNLSETRNGCYLKIDMYIKSLSNKQSALQILLLYYWL